MKEQTMQDLWNDSYLSSGDAYLDALYDTYLKNPTNVATEWKDYFDTLGGKGKDVSHADVQAYFQQLVKQPNRVTNGISSPHDEKQEKVIDLINAYRNVGHLQADIDPLKMWPGVDNPTLELSYYGFSESDLDKVFDVGTFSALRKSSATLREIYETLRKVYCGTIGAEYMHISNNDEVLWIQQRMEDRWPFYAPSDETKLRIYDRLMVADGFERYLATKYVGQKRFGLEGGDALIPMLDGIVNRSSHHSVREIVIGMAHRGRLNVLINILGKESGKLFSAFEGKGIDEKNSGDVKYHLGFSSDVKTEHGNVHLALAFNPSHLEIVSPVVQGSVRARQRRRRDTEHKLVVPIQIHGDAAFSGQGVVAETFTMSQARWFTVGGSIHIVINNQIGFTTSNPLDARSTVYCTDIAKMVQAPIFHVNGNDPEAVYFAALMAIDYRSQFKKDIVIDLVCYRRNGHNEADEPAATQPIMYKVIRSMPTPAALYGKKLAEEGLLNEEKEKELFENYRAALDAGKAVVETIPDPSAYEYAIAWEPYTDKSWKLHVKTGLPVKHLKQLATQLEKLPEGFVVQPQVKKTLEARQKMTTGELPLNWGYAENLCYATLLDQGYPIRLCGQDASRGTFAHRHAVLHDQNTDRIYIPLSHIKPGQVQINIIDSLLSEEAVLAFEYGFATAEPNNLVIWEAQYGDFVNGAQVVIDQFISSGEQKWKRLCGLVMYLPHGYEGGGPEHSSARLERFLQLCAQDNMQVCVPTTPAQQFHMIRRQMLRPYRAPLIVMSPKSLLRHPLAVSTLDELSDGEFHLVIPEIDNIKPEQVERVILCSGKVYYDLLEKRREKKMEHVAIIRIEQLYPFPKEKLNEILHLYKNANEFVWCQEEPQNQGAWHAILADLYGCVGKQILYAGRPASASPAVGYMSVHQRQQQELVQQALER